MNARLLATVGLLALVVLAGCSAAPIEGDLGKENGYRYDAQIDVTTADGLNESERTAVVSRAMARIERIRGVEFEKTVSVEVISRDEFRNQSGGGRVDASNLTDRQLWNEQVWEGLHIIGEDTTYPSTSSSNRGSTVVGYYSGSKEKIVIVSDSPTPQISRDTLVHELYHALQDQQFNFGTNPQLQDKQLAQRGVTEGEANYIEALYRNRCGTEWSCIPLPERSGGSASDSDSFNRALFLTSFAPYAEGPWFVDAVRDRGGWEAVDDLYTNFPNSTEQIIHPEAYPDEQPVNVSLADRSNGEWSRFDDIDRPVYDTVGEASIYAMFQGNGLVGRSGSEQYEYDHPFSAGWDGDKLIPYRNDGKYGYVWRTRWESPEDAREFADAYRELLAQSNATDLGDGRFRIQSGPFADAFRLTRSGATVTIVNAPTTDELDGVHAAN